MDTEIFHKLEEFGRYTTAITFKYEYCYIKCVLCLIERHKKISVCYLGNDMASSLTGSLNLLTELLEKEKTYNIQVPELYEQPLNNGYCHKLIGNIQFSFKRINNNYYLTGILEKDESGYSICPQPYPVPADFVFVKMLVNGDQLYSWDSLGMLSGNAGEAIVRDGIVIKSKTTAIA